MANLRGDSRYAAMSPRNDMPLLVRIITVMVLIAASAFCVFGFMATFEPIDRNGQMTWRMIYGLVGSLCAAAATWILCVRRPSR